MVVSGNMIWEYSKCQAEYTEVVEYFKNSLGLYALDHDLDHKVLLPYYTAIIKWTNAKLIAEATEDMRAKVSLILDLYTYVADQVCLGPVIGVEDPITGAQELAKEILGENILEDENYDQDRFIFCLGDFFSSLRLRLKFQYIHFFEQEVSGDCCTCGAKGQDEDDYESWTSGSYPNDEEYDRANYMKPNSAWKVSKDRVCDCYRRQ